jgi:hypothetical protein
VKETHGNWNARKKAWHGTELIFILHLLWIVSGFWRKRGKTEDVRTDQKSSSSLAGRQLHEHLLLIHHGTSTAPIKADLFQPLPPPCHAMWSRNEKKDRQTDRWTNARSSSTTSRKHGLLAQRGHGGFLGEEKFFSSDTTNGCNFVGLTKVYKSRHDLLNSYSMEKGKLVSSCPCLCVSHTN